jgi:hypothetical protein
VAQESEERMNPEKQHWSAARVALGLMYIAAAVVLVLDVFVWR